ncbi:unnamed protein product [Mytilus edulis]|uniref:G-protein coupled receptors family 1 profile domain-containing protein n=1 Tax=Mytilus edulis TaxID=6550 RepID=A0A8S3V6D1_MYTED|nr:unnamed protein product [Mytilus edulis]
MTELPKNLTVNITTSRPSDNFGVLPLSVGIPIILITFCSICVSLVVIFSLIRSKTGNFFTWKVIDRFSLYTVLLDLFLYTTQTSYGIHQRFGKSTRINDLACSIYGILILEFAVAQVILCSAMAVYAFSLVVRNQNLNLGKWDSFIILPAIGATLTEFTVAAYFDKFSPNPVYCSLKEERGFLTFHFIQICLGILISFVIIIVLYLIMWCFIKRQTKMMNRSFGQQSAVNSRRLALKLSLFVLVHVIQFGGNAVEGLWISIEEPPMNVRYATIFIGATGGMMNGLVFLTARK